MSEIQNVLLRQQKQEMLKLDLGSITMVGVIILFVPLIVITGIAMVALLIQLDVICLIFAALTALLAYNIRMCWRVFSQARAKRASLIYDGIITADVLSGSEQLIGGLSSPLEAEGGDLSMSVQGGGLSEAEREQA